jgi:thymidylate synthase
MTVPSATWAWLNLLDKVYTYGQETSPRGMLIREKLACSATIDLNQPIVIEPLRELGYKFMAAEAAWIMSGDDRVETIKDYAKHISSFSDNGETFFGAYGPKIVDQLPYVIEKLAEDRDTRQAVLTIWRESPPPSKDIPCTVSIQWFIRNGKIYCIDTMRSSDLWLGWPYDIFNFSMLTHYLRLELRNRGIDVEPGTLTLFAGSQHIYERNFKAVEEILRARTSGDGIYRPENKVLSVSDTIDEMQIPGELIDTLWLYANGSGALKMFDKSGE